MTDIMRPKENREAGFTLIELLVVLAIIGILSAIGVTNFIQYKQKSFNAIAQQDLRNGITAEEAAFVDTETYSTCNGADNCETTLPAFKSSRNPDGTSAMSVLKFDGDATGFTAQMAHGRGSRTYVYDSSVGQISFE